MRQNEQLQLERFLDNHTRRPMLGLVYGRRRIGKSTLLVRETADRGGFYYEAQRIESSVQLERLGRALGEYLGVGRIAFDGWEEAITSLLRLGERQRLPVVLDEFGWILKADASVPSVISTALGPARSRSSAGEARLVLCGSAIALMRSLVAGESELRGRAALELVMQADDFRVAATRLGNPDALDLALATYSVIGGVVGYATDMVGYDLPQDVADFDRWVVERVLSPAATLHHEATTLLAEDPEISESRNLLISHSILDAIASGSVEMSKISRRLKRPVSNLAPALGRLVEAGYAVRHEDPIRAQRTSYALADPFLQFHFAVLEPNGSLLRDRSPGGAWDSRLRHVFESRVRGPVFEEMARMWVRRWASDKTLPVRDHVGPSYANYGGTDHELDIVVAGEADQPSGREIVALGEAKSGEMLTRQHLRRLEEARASLGVRAASAKLLLFGADPDTDLRAEAAARRDVEIVDLERLYRGD